VAQRNLGNILGLGRPIFLPGTAGTLPILFTLNSTSSELYDSNNNLITTYNSSGGQNRIVYYIQWFSYIPTLSSASIPSRKIFIIKSVTDPRISQIVQCSIPNLIVNNVITPFISGFPSYDSVFNPYGFEITYFNTTNIWYLSSRYGI
jgi:hypothetical protein